MKVVVGNYYHEIKIRGSIFKTYIHGINNLDDLKRLRADFQSKYSGATHICYGYRFCDTNRVDLFGEPEIIEYCIDDGEPSGTAGRPILNMLRKYSLINTSIFVIRYFGGIKLGIPGLIEAYRESSEKIIRKSKIEKWIFLKEISIIFNYQYSKIIEKIIKENSGKIIVGDYLDKIKLIIEIPYKNIAIFKKNITEKSMGTIKVIE